MDARPEAEPRTRGGIAQKRGAEKRDLEEPLTNTLHGCVETAKRNVGLAYDLLDPKMNILPENIADAAQSLETAKRNIEHLETLLQSEPLHPKYGRIIDQVRIVTDQIDNHLAPFLQPSVSLNVNVQEKFKTLLEALKILDILIPK